MQVLEDGRDLIDQRQRLGGQVGLAAVEQQHLVDIDDDAERLQRDAHLAVADQRLERLGELFIGGVEPLDVLLDLIAQGGGRAADR